MNYFNPEERIKDKFEKRIINHSGFVYSPGQVVHQAEGLYEFRSEAEIIHSFPLGEGRNRYGLSSERFINCSLNKPSSMKSEFIFPSKDGADEVRINSDYICRVDIKKK